MSTPSLHRRAVHRRVPPTHGRSTGTTRRPRPPRTSGTVPGSVACRDTIHPCSARPPGRPWTFTVAVGSRARPFEAVGAVAAGLPVVPVRRGDGAPGPGARTVPRRGRTSLPPPVRTVPVVVPAGSGAVSPGWQWIGVRRRVTTSPAGSRPPDALHDQGDPRSRNPSQHTTIPTTGSRSSTRGSGRSRIGNCCGGGGASYPMVMPIHCELRAVRRWTEWRERAARSCGSLSHPRRTSSTPRPRCSGSCRRNRRGGRAGGDVLRRERAPLRGEVAHGLPEPVPPVLRCRRRRRRSLPPRGDAGQGGGRFPQASSSSSVAQVMCAPRSARLGRMPPALTTRRHHGPVRMGEGAESWRGLLGHAVASGARLRVAGKPLVCGDVAAGGPSSIPRWETVNRCVRAGGVGCGSSDGVGPAGLTAAYAPRRRLPQRRRHSAYERPCVHRWSVAVSRSPVSAASIAVVDRSRSAIDSDARDCSRSRDAPASGRPLVPLLDGLARSHVVHGGERAVTVPPRSAAWGPRWPR